MSGPKQWTAKIEVRKRFDSDTGERRTDLILGHIVNEQGSDEATLWGPGGDIEAVARLMAAAPEMLVALKECAESLAFARDKLGMCGDGDGPGRNADRPDDIGSHEALQRASAAIAKAESQTSWRCGKCDWEKSPAGAPIPKHSPRCPLRAEAGDRP